MFIDENVFDYGFEGKCPAKSQVSKVARAGMQSGASKIEIWWGENMIELEKAYNGLWFGRGWIRSISGQDLAEELA
jgi:hypothetical protein